jgi:hypothetical protein
METRTFVVFSPGRTGSTLITKNINQWAGRDIAYATHNPNFVHSDEFIPFHDDLVCILSKRRNVFRAALSQLVLEHTQEPTFYTGTKNTPFVADINRFMGLYNQYTIFYNSINVDMYKQVIDITFEDIFEDDEYLFRQIGIKQKTDYSLCQKSPYDYYNLITNIDDIITQAKLNGWDIE